MPWKGLNREQHSLGEVFAQLPGIWLVEGSEGVNRDRGRGRSGPTLGGVEVRPFAGKGWSSWAPGREKKETAFA